MLRYTQHHNGLSSGVEETTIVLNVIFKKNSSLCMEILKQNCIGV